MITAAQRRSLEEAIVDTVREPLIVLDDALRRRRRQPVLLSRVRGDIAGHRGPAFLRVGNGQWNIPALRELLADIIPHHTTIEEFEVEHDFPTSAGGRCC